MSPFRLWAWADIISEIRSVKKTALQMVSEAIEGGVTFFDNCWEYHPQV